MNIKRFEPHSQPALARINVRDLRLRTYIGFNPEEKEKKQDIVVNLEIDYIVSSGALQDHVDDALDYKVITKRVIDHVENGRFLLLERLVGDVLAICCDHTSVQKARVTIDKPHALRFADSVSLTLAFDASEKQHLNLLEKAS